MLYVKSGCYLKEIKVGRLPHAVVAAKNTIQSPSHNMIIEYKLLFSVNKEHNDIDSILSSNVPFAQHVNRNKELLDVCCMPSKQCQQTNLFFLIYQSYSLRSSSTCQGHIFCNYKKKSKSTSQSSYNVLNDLPEGIISIFVVLYCIKQIDSIFTCICSIIDHRSHQNVDTLTYIQQRVLIFLFLVHILTALITFLSITYLCWTLCGNRSVLTHSQQPPLFLHSSDNPGQTMQREKKLFFGTTLRLE